MKKLMVVLMGLLFSASAFAQEAKGPQFKYSVWANAFAITETQAATDQYADYSNLRVRPMFTLSNENVSVVTRLEIDQFFGNTTNTQTGSALSKNAHAPKGADQLNVEVKNVYIDVKDMFMPGLSLRAGVAGYKYPIAFDDDVALFNIFFDAGMVKFDLAYVKLREDKVIEETTTGKNNDDVHFYAAKADIKAGSLTITPALLYMVGEKEATYTAGATGTYAQITAELQNISNRGELTKMMPAISLAMKEGPLSFNADFVYVTGENKTADTKFNAYAGYVNVNYAVSSDLKVNVFGLYATGQDDSDKITSFNGATWGDIEVGPMFIINDAGRINQVGVTNEFDKSAQGLIMFGLGAEFKMDKLTVLGQVAYAMSADDTLTDEKALGTELNLRLTYEVAPRTSVWAEAAYLAAGKYVEAAYGDDKPMYYAAGVMTNF